MFRDWYPTHTSLVLRWMSTHGWGGCSCPSGACRFLPPILGRDLLGVVIGPTTEWAKWGLIFQGLHCVNTFYQFSSDPLNELSADAVPVGCISGLMSLSWYDEEDLLNLVRFVLDNGGDADARRPDGQTALFSAVHHSALRVVNELLTRGAKVNAVDESGNSVLVGLGGLPHSDYEQDKACLRMLVRKNLSVDALIASANSYTSVDYQDIYRKATHCNDILKVFRRVKAARTGGDRGRTLSAVLSAGGHWRSPR
jgi:hypothetical protein